MEENDRAAQRWRRVWTPLLAAALFFTTASLAAAAQEIALQMDPLHSTINFTLGDVLHTVRGTFSSSGGICTLIRRRASSGAKS